MREAESIFLAWFNKFSVLASEVLDADSMKAERYMTK